MCRRGNQLTSCEVQWMIDALSGRSSRVIWEMGRGRGAGGETGQPLGLMSDGRAEPLTFAGRAGRGG